jgi:hypothetical protein
MIFYDILLFRAKCWKKITLNGDFHLNDSTRWCSSRSCCPVSFSSSSFLHWGVWSPHSKKASLVHRKRRRRVLQNGNSRVYASVACRRGINIWMQMTQIYVKSFLLEFKRGGKRNCFHGFENWEFSEVGHSVDLTIKIYSLVVGFWGQEWI